MSSFGVKQPMKKVILNEDEWFINAKDMCSWLEKHFEGDDTKFYSHIDAEANTKLRKNGKGEGYPIKGSRSYHIIACDKDGNFTTLPFTQNSSFIDEIRNGSKTTLIEEHSDENSETEDEDNFRLSHDTIFEMLESGVYMESVYGVSLMLWSHFT